MTAGTTTTVRRGKHEQADGNSAVPPTAPTPTDKVSGRICRRVEQGEVLVGAFCDLGIQFGLEYRNSVAVPHVLLEDDTVVR